MNTWMEWLREAAGWVSDREIARRVGVSPSSVGRWADTPPKVENVVTIARTFGAPVSEALVAAGYVSRDELHTPQAIRNLGAFTSRELLAELNRRIDDTPIQPAPTGPVTDPSDYGEEPRPDDWTLAAGHVSGAPDRLRPQ